MRRTALLLLLATTATCYGQSNADIPADRPTSESSHIDEDQPRLEQSNEEAQRVEQNNAEMAHFYRARQDEEMETLRRQQQPENTFSAPIQRNIGKQYKQKERPSVSSTGHAGKSKPLGHTTPAPHKPSNDSSKNSSNQQSGGINQNPKRNANRN